MPNPVVIVGDAANVFSDARGFVTGIQSGINAVNAGDLAGGMAALSAILATHSSVFAQLAPVASGLTIAADLAKLQDAIATNNFDQGVDAALGLIGGVGGLLALSPLPQTKALGIAISALANASKEIYKNREDIANALNDINRALSTDPYSPVTILDPQSLIDNGLLDPNTLLPKVDPEKFNPADYPDLKHEVVWGPNPAVSDGYRSAKTPPPRDPLAIDLDGDGIETLGIPTDGSSPVLFDHNANGIKTGTGWLTGDDAWLVMDRDGNGSIDSGRELFGVDTEITVTAFGSGGPYTYTRKANSGFEALRSLDENGDSVFNASDSAFTQVKLWQDVNRDGVSQASELFTLADKGIASISLNETTATTNLGNGNSITGTAVVTRTNGSTTAIDSVDLTAGNLNLADNPFYREFTDEIPLTEAAMALPEMGASGWVRDMREAMSLGTEQAQAFTEAVSAFAQATTADGQKALLDDLLTDWAKTTGRYNQSGDPYLTMTTVSTAGNGQPSMVRFATANPNVATGDRANIRLGSDSYYTTVNYPVIGPVQVLTSEGAEVMRRIAVLEAFNGSRFIDFTVTLSGGGSGSSSGSGSGGVGGEAPSVRQWDVTISTQQIAFINSAYEALENSVYNALVMQTRLKPYLDAVELVIDESGIHFDTAAVTALLETTKAADERKALTDLIDLNRLALPTLDAVGFNGLGMLRGWIEALPSDSPLRAELASFHVFMAQATTGTAAEDLYFGSSAGDNFYARAGNDALDGGDGIDQLNGEAGSDTLLGGAGNDYLYGNTTGWVNVTGAGGADVYDGGAGNDQLTDYEYTDGDAYRLNLGGGQDWVTDGGGVGDRIEVGAGINVSDVVVRNNGTALVVINAPTGDYVAVSDSFDNNGNTTGRAIEEVRFADGTVWDAAAIKAQALIGSNAAESIFGFNTDDAMTGAGGNDNLYGRTGDDSIDGGDGIDQLNGEAGSDTLLGGAGNDYLYGNTTGWANVTGAGGADVYDGGAGNDQLTDYEYTDGDVYRLNLGGGQDWVTDGGGVDDRIEVGADINVSDVVVRNNGTALVVINAPTGDYVAVSDSFDSNGNTTGRAIEEVRFADGTVWDAAAIRAQALIGSSAAESIFGFNTDDAMTGAGGNDNLYGRTGDDSIDGGDGIDQLDGEAGSDTLLGGAGNDYLYGNTTGWANVTGAGGADVYDGGAGNDQLTDYEYTDGDVYRLNLGGGQDWVTDGGGVGDRIEVGAGINVSDVVVRNNGTALVVINAPTGDYVAVSDSFDNNGNTTGRAIEEVRFADGTVWDAAAIKAQALIGSNAAESIFGFNTDDAMTGAGGNDNLYGRTGDDSIDGGDGIDQLDGEAGSDTLLGGAGNDYLYGNTTGWANVTGPGGADTYDGGAGNDQLTDYEYTDGDVYRLNLGGGQDWVTDGGGTGDRIEVGLGLTASDLIVTRSGNNLDFTLAGTNDKLTIANWYSSTSYQIESVTFSDGITWDAGQIAAAVLNPVNGTATADTLTGTASADWLQGQAGADTLEGQAGHDRLDGGAGDDTLRGGAGDDVYEVDSAGDSVTENANEGNDTVRSSVTWTLGAEIENLVLTGTAATNATGNALDNRLVGNDAANRIDGGAGADALTGRGGDDIYVVDHAGDTVTELAGGGTDSVESSVSHTLAAQVENLLLTGTAANTATGNDLANLLTGNSANNTLTGGAGNDTLDGQGGADTMIGGTGDDWYVVDASTDVVTEAAGEGRDGIRSMVSLALAANVEDAILLGTQNLMVNGNALGNRLVGNSVANTLYGFDGDDTLDGGAGIDSHYGGAGNDTYIVEVSGDKVFELANEGVDTIQSYVTWSLGANCENLTLLGSDAINASGTSLGNVLTGNTASNTLMGYAGDDTLIGGGGADTLNGGTGHDTFVVDSIDDVVVEAASQTDGGNDTVLSSVSWTLGWHTENLILTGEAATNATGNELANTLTGNGSANTLTGLAGNDMLDGSAGDDTLIGGTGADVYRFGSGYGLDTVQENDATSGVVDALQFGAGIGQSDLAFARVGNNLEAVLGNGADKIVVKDWYLGSRYHVEEFRFADGSVLLDSQVEALVSAMAGFSAPAGGESSGSTASIGVPSQQLAANALA